MDNQKCIETFGFISKEEDLATLKHNILPNTLVIENVEPFPGYHGLNIPTENKHDPQYVFFVTKKKYSVLYIARTTERIKKYFEHDFDAASGEISIYNRDFPCIRIKDLKKFDYVSKLQECYQSEGIAFAKQKKVKATGLIQVQRYFNITEIGDGIYQDKDEARMSYFEIPEALNWSLFATITGNIKNNFKLRNFDVALGSFFRSTGLVELVRVYDKQTCDLAKLKDLKAKYEAEIKKYS